MIYTLADAPLLSLSIAKLLFHQWSSVYNYKTPEELDKWYVRNNVHYDLPLTFAMVSSKKKVLGCFTLHYNYFNLTLSDVIVDPAYRNHGLGSKMIKYAIQWAHEHTNASRLYLWIEKLSMSTFYEKLGFELNGQMDSDGRYQMSLQLREGGIAHWIPLLFGIAVLVACLIM